MADRTEFNFNTDRSGESIDFSAVPAASLLRAAADGELDAEAQARLAEHLAAYPDAERRIAFESGLRDACAKAMGDIPVPAGLADRVKANLAQPESTDQERLADALADRAAETRSPSFWSNPAMRTVGALAAVLVLAFSVVFAVRGFQSGPTPTNGYSVELARFVAAEHSRVSDNEAAADAKFNHGEPQSVAATLAALLGHSPEMPDCSRKTVTFGGGSECKVPGKGPSTHFQFFVEPADNIGPPERLPVSVFVKRDSGELDLEPGITYSVNTAACGVTNARIYVWQRDGLVYVLVARGADAGGCARVLESMNVAPATAEL